MSFERSDTAFYDSREKNFQEALTDLAQLAYFTALENKIMQEKDVGPVVFRAEETETGEEGVRAEYSFYTEGDNSVEVQSVVSTRIDDLTDEAAQLIYEDMRESDARKLRYELDEIKGAEVEHFVRRSYRIDLAAKGGICVETDTGYSVDLLEIVRATDEDEPLRTMEHENIFGIDELREFMQALYTLGLADDTQIRQFLDKPF